LEVFISETSSVSCSGRSDGRLSANSRGGVGNHEYVWYRINGNNVKQAGTLKDAGNLPAGTYRVQVIDGNGIAVNSPDFELAEPAALKAFTASSSISCQGTENTWLEASAEGGTAPYCYLWTSGHQTARVENLSGDKYMVLVADARGCETKATAEIRTAPEMTVETSAVQPLCVDDGAIAVNVKGGIAPYKFLWNDGSIDKNRNNLPAGNYSVTITGANECPVQTDIKLDKAKPASLDLGNDRTVLCNGQQVVFNVSDIDGMANYKWFRNGALFAETPAVSINEEGLYIVEVVNSKGCRSEGSIDISVENSSIEADFTVATKAIRYEITKLVNVSYPYPDKAEWIIPNDPDISIIDMTDEYVEIVFREKRSYTIGLRSSTGECRAVIYKQIDVYDRYDIPEYEPEENVFLKSFIAYPNPNKGQFTVKIELGAKADVRLRLISITGSIIDERELKGSSYYEILYNINNVQGIYLLQLASEKVETSLKLLMDSF
ncbi:MAG: T9SS type A sorting domain-containing protein, partial [Prevotellaceae bacterium]|nr:T9SS type A sorting domain-containing protein [Prevotellaceae bacterium]